MGRVLLGSLALATAAAPAQAAKPKPTPKPTPVPAAISTPTSYSSPGYTDPKPIPDVSPAPYPVVSLGTGKYPHVLVDPAGTGHVMFSTDGGSTEPDTVSYCRLQRGQTSCSSTASLAPDAPAGGGGAGNPFIGNFPGGNHDFNGAVPLSNGNQLFLVDRRFPDAFATPGGKTSDSNVFLWTSQDGGGTFTGPAIIGDNEMGGGAVVYGGADNPSIGTLNRTQTVGTFFQGVGAGTYTTAKAQLGTPDQAYDGSLAVDGTNPIAAFADEIHGPTGTVFVREWTGSGDVNDPSTWTSTSFPGSAPRIAAGPLGVYVIYRDSLSGGNTLVRQITGGGTSASAPTQLAGAGSEASIAQSPTGGLVSAWIDSAGVQLRRSVDGVNWDPAQLVAALPPGGSLSALSIAATADGGGFASMVQNATGAEGVGQVVAAVFGTQNATGLPGLGQLPGGGLGSAIGDQFASTTCAQATFGAVTAQLEEGCWLHDASNQTMDVTLGNVNLNGLKIVPDAGVKIGVDPQLHTIDTTGAVSVLLVSGNVKITLFHGTLHVKLPVADVGSDLFDFSGITPPDIAGFPVKGDVDIKLVKDGVSIPISLSLPRVFGGITGSATLSASLSTGFQLSSMEFKVGSVNFGGAELRDVDVSYTASNDLWAGKATLNVPPGGGAFSLSLAVAFQGGQYKSGSFTVGLPYPGIPLDANDTPPQLYFSGGGASLGLEPLTITGTASFGLVPLYTTAGGGGNPLRDYAFSLDGTLGVSFGKPITLTATATGYLYTVQVAKATLTYGLPDQVKLVGSEDLTLGPFQQTGSISAVIDPEHKQYGGQISGDMSINLSKLGVPTAALLAAGITDGKVHIPTAALAFNAKGIGAYIPFGLSPIPFTVAYHWGDAVPAIYPFVKRLGEFTSGLPAAGSRVARREAVGSTFRVPKGAPSVAVDVRGTGGAPSIVLTDPNGKQVTPQTTFTAGAKAVVVGDAEHEITHLGIKNPAPGRWTVSQTTGSQVPLAGVTSAPGLADPTVKANVTGKGARRTLRYSVKAPKGLTVSFAEQGSSTYQVISKAKRGKGTLTFTPVAGGNPSRKIIALIDTGSGLPSSRATLASFKATPPATPKKPTRLTVKAGNSGFTVKFKVPTAATHTIVFVTATDGRVFQQVLPKKTHTLLVPAVGAQDGITVKVTGQNALGKLGSSASASARYK